jgi:hypothetical protein
MKPGNRTAFGKVAGKLPFPSLARVQTCAFRSLPLPFSRASHVPTIRSVRMSEPFDLITGKPLEPWAKQALARHHLAQPCAAEAMLRADIARLADWHADAHCDECGAPLFDNDETDTDEAETAALCAGHRTPGAPVYSYRIATPPGQPETRDRGAIGAVREPENTDSIADMVRLRIEKARREMYRQTEKADDHLRIALELLATLATPGLPAAEQEGGE